MEIIFAILFLLLIGYILIKLWIKFVNLIMNPLIRRAEKKEEKLQFEKQSKYLTDTQNNNELLNIQKANEKLGVLNKTNETKQFDDQFYFKNYDKIDGEWINKGETLCFVYTSSNQKGEPIYSSKSGYLEHTKKYGEKLFKNEEMSIIHKEGKYKNENSPLKNEYKHYGKNDIDKWFVTDGDFVNVGENIYQYENSNFEIQINKSKKEGYIDIEVLEETYSREYKEYLLYTIRENDNIRQEKYINIPNIIVDDFTNSKIIRWKNVSSLYPKYIEEKLQGITSKSDNHLTDLFFTFNYLKNNDYIVFHFNPKKIKPVENDKIVFLFESNERIIFNLNRNPITLKNNKTENVLEIKFIITKHELDLFANQNFKKWKVILEKDEKEVLGGNFGEINNYKSKSNLKIVIKKFANDYIKLVNN